MERLAVLGPEEKIKRKLESGNVVRGRNGDGETRGAATTGTELIENRRN